MLERVRPFIPPKLLPYGYHAYSLVQYFRFDRFRDLRPNRALRGKFTGQRAFVIGNGSSLAKMDLGKLAGEKLFTVNRFFRHAPKLRPLCHFFMDPSFFASPETDLADYAAMRDPSTLCFAPLWSRDVMRRHIPDAHFLFTSGSMGANKNADISKPIPEVQTVTLAALITALHMGFDPIYLIGCDMDFLSDVRSVNPLKVVVRHFYDVDHVEVVDSAYDYPGFVQAAWRMLDGYRQIKQHMAPGRRIYNAGVGGFLDEFERVDFESLF